MPTLEQLRKYVTDTSVNAESTLEDFANKVRLGVTTDRSDYFACWSDPYFRASAELRVLSGFRRYLEAKPYDRSAEEIIRLVTQQAQQEVQNMALYATDTRPTQTEELVRLHQLAAWARLVDFLSGRAI